jgi:hypothetical protein
MNNREHRVGLVSTLRIVWLVLMRFEHSTGMLISVKLVTVGFSAYWISLGYYCSLALDISACDFDCLEGTG